MSTLKQSINEQFIEVLTSNIFEQTNHISEQMEENDKFAYFQNKLENLNENLIGYSKMIDTFIAGNSELPRQLQRRKAASRDSVTRYPTVQRVLVRREAAWMIQRHP